MFRLSDTPIEAHPATQDRSLDAAGALVVFEGRVRNRNAGREVRQLEYEGAETLAANEFQRIEQEALDRFDILEVRCIHRTGVLQIGDMAVWIAVLSAHRGPAFEACRYVIDELKQRLPIWKKEYYLDGESDWINAP